MDNEDQVRELLLKEYIEGGLAARQHEQLTRASVSVFLPTLLALAGFIVGSGVSNGTKAVLAVGGLAVSLLVLNIVRRHQLYYRSYIKRARDIEATIKVQDAQVIKLYTLGRGATHGSRTFPSKTAFLVFFIFTAIFFLVSAVVYFIHIICTIRPCCH